MILCIILILLIPAADLTVLRFVPKHSYTLYTHLCLVVFGDICCMYMHYTFLLEQLMTIYSLLLIICAVCGITIYIVDLAVKNIIQNDVLILDWKYYFCPKKKLHLSVVFSVLIACGEEVIFRLPICVFAEQKFLLLFVGSIAYGIVHLFFSRYDACSKIVLGLLFGIIAILMKNIFCAVVVHAIYNILAGFFGGTDHVKLQE